MPLNLSSAFSDRAKLSEKELRATLVRRFIAHGSTADLAQRRADTILCLRQERIIEGLIRPRDREPLSA